MEANKNIPVLCASDLCMGCGACSQSCKSGAIAMVSDSHGFLHPVINLDKCIGCGLCAKKCPVGNDEYNRNDKARKVIACWHKDNEIRMTSSSGGVFTALAEYVLSLNGIVWGAAYDENMHLRYEGIDKVQDLGKLRRSKYVQCEIGDTFIQIKKQLADGKLVLFCGTSCHVRGLYQVVGSKLNENLITADFICHGVPSPKVFAEYIKWIEQKYGDKLVDFNFRDKRYGWDNGVLTVGTFRNIGERKFMNDENSYFTGMLNNMFIRQSCYQCTSNGLRRHADFTIADFWGIGRNVPYEHEMEKTKGISMCALNSNKAIKIFKSYLQNRLNWTERTLEEAVAGNSNYERSSICNPKAYLFWKTFENSKDWNGVIKVLRPTFVQKCKLFVKRYFGPVLANKLRKLIGR
ncbi:MAG: Coenzyme F420 hydrogenase/dehydrogenase, beta subunit C-terminal domain [Bacteroides sp.]|nr:Coenzyme F420 hydrogenase/dehydrogenase, beta subunit C-terminal domain [Bacteroides sp.]MCM1447173.1 Coenzyme F420 hydrogenase/dehydrogenase, beta subunit C-terminal domain [Bacteroides sp.]